MTTTTEAPAVSPTAELMAQEVRAALARRRMSTRELARRTPRGAQYWWRRMSGEVPLDIVDLALIAGALDVSLASLVAPLDARTTERAPAVGEGPAAGVVRPEGFEPPTFWFGASPRRTLIPAGHGTRWELAA